MSKRISVRLDDQEEEILQKLKYKINVKTDSEAIRYLISNSLKTVQTEFSCLTESDNLIKISKDCKLLLELLKQFYGEMSYKDFDPGARKNERVKQFMDDYYHSEDKFMK